METDFFEFEFDHAGKKMQATCYVYTKKGETMLPYKTPIYRVAVNSHTTNPFVFLFYQTNETKQRFSWYPFAESHQLMGESIAIALKGLDHREAD